jgi:Hemerythrin HHE cation binding domain
MPGALHDHLAHDHDRLDALLAAALRADGTIDAASYAEFRRGLLRHIAIEEKVLFPEIGRESAGSALREQLHRDHAALAALLVPPPAADTIEAVRAILREHNPLEEEQGGLYELVERLEGDALEDLMARVRAVPPVAVAPHVDNDFVRTTIEHLLREAEDGRARLRE